MAQLNFENIRLVVADAGGQIREEIKSIVHHEGFRDITLLDNLKSVRDVVAENQVDLLIIDHEFPRGNVQKFIRRIRHHEIGSNPFIVIITLALDPEKEEIMRIIDSGSDDLLHWKRICAISSSRKVRKKPSKSELMRMAASRWNLMAVPFLSQARLSSPIKRFPS